MKLPSGSLIRKLLLENGLNAVLISNPDFKSSCLSLSVKAGSSDEPSEHPGLAHLLEHCIFHAKSSEFYENDFRDFIVLNSGFTNAYTTYDKTTYFFKVHSKKFIEAVNRFASILTNPYFCVHGFEKGIKEVDSEHKFYINSDENRVNELLIEFLKENSLDKRFQCGNKESLSKDKTFEQMIKFFEDNYLADRMNLVLSGSQGLDDLTLLAAKFSGLRKSSKKKQKIVNTELNFTGDAFNPVFYKNGVHFDSSNNEKSLYILINCVGLDDEVPRDSLSFFQFLINDKDERSLTAELRRLGYAFAVNCSLIPGHDFFLIKFKFDLTEAGIEQYENVIEIFRKYLKNLDVGKDCYNRYKAVLMHNFNLLESPTQLKLTYKISNLLHNHPINSIIKNGLRVGGFRKSDMNHLIERQLNRSKWIILLGKKELNYKYKEKVSKIGYNLVKMKSKEHTENILSKVYRLIKKILKKTSFQKKLSKSAITSKVDIEKIEDLILNCEDTQDFKEYTFHKKFEYGEIHLLFNNKISQHKSDVYVQMITENSLKSRIAMNIRLQLSVESFQEKAGDFLKTNGIVVSIINTDIGSVVKFSGLCKQIQETVNEFLNYFQRVTLYNLAMAIELRKRNIFVDLTSNPLSFADSVIALSAISGKTIDKELEILSSITEEDVLNAKKFYLKLMAVGPLEEAKLLQIYEAISPNQKKPSFYFKEINNNMSIKSSNFSTNPTYNWVFKYFFIYKLTYGNYFIDKFTYYRKIAIGIVVHTISEALFFNRLRTKHQFGYVVTCDKFDLSVGSLISFFIQSEMSVKEIENKIEIFIDELKSYLKNLTEQSLKEIKDGIISSLEDPFLSLSELSKDFFQFALQDIYDVKQKQFIVNAIRGITRDDIIFANIFNGSYTISLES